MFFNKKVKVGKSQVDNTIRDLSTNPFTEQELLDMLVQMVNVDINTNSDFKKAESLMFARLKDSEGFIDYLNETLARDVKRHFSASSPLEQATIRGAFARTAYWKGLLVNKPTTNTKDTKIVSRYAK